MKGNQMWCVILLNYPADYTQYNNHSTDVKQTTLKVGELLTPLLVGIAKVVWKESVDCFISAAH